MFTLNTSNYTQHCIECGDSLAGLDAKDGVCSYCQPIPYSTTIHVATTIKSCGHHTEHVETLYDNPLERAMHVRCVEGCGEYVAYSTTICECERGVDHHTN